MHCLARSYEQVSALPATATQLAAAPPPYSDGRTTSPPSPSTRSMRLSWFSILLSSDRLTKPTVRELTTSWTDMAVLHGEEAMSEPVGAARAARARRLPRERLLQPRGGTSAEGCHQRLHCNVKQRARSLEGTWNEAQPRAKTCAREVPPPHLQLGQHNPEHDQRFGFVVERKPARRASCNVQLARLATTQRTT